MDTKTAVAFLKNWGGNFHPVVPFNPSVDSLYLFDFTSENKSLSAATIADTESFASYINQQLETHHATYGIGGYAEHRTLYARSSHFGAGEESRRLHLGTDIWGPAGIRVMAPLEGIVHSFAFNNQNSDYGATIILCHNLEGVIFYTLYGHLSLNSIKNLQEGNRIRAGEVFGEFGMRFENGNWPPHLHFQIILDMKGYKGDYPGVCRFSERETWLQNSPDPDLILRLHSFLPSN